MMTSWWIRANLVALLCVCPDLKNNAEAESQHSLQKKSTALTPKVKKVTKRALKMADRAHRRSNSKELARALQKIRKSDADHPALFFYEAVLRVLNKDDALALDALRALSQINDRRTPIYKVRARRSKTFKHLLTNTDFRKLVGIDVDPALPRTAYERLVGFGGKWQQLAVPCEKAGVDLDLDAERYKFFLIISSRCQGSEEKTRLKGQWNWQGADTLDISFPNQEQGLEDMTCSLSVCTDDRSEDCLRCAPESDLEFLLKPIRQ